MFLWSERAQDDPGVPERVHNTLKSRAAREGMSLSDFIKKELERMAERPSMHEWLERTIEAKPLRTKKSATQVIRELGINDNRFGCFGGGRLITNGILADIIRNDLFPR